MWIVETFHTELCGARHSPDIRLMDDVSGYGWFTMFVGTASYLVAAYMFWWNSFRLKNWVSVRGKVIRKFDDTDSDGVKLDIEFIAEDGEHCLFTNHISKDDNYRVGDTVQVVYDPNNRSDAVVNDAHSLWLVPSIAICVGTGFWLLACLGL